jgi:hypothetical protein
MRFVAIYVDPVVNHYCLTGILTKARTLSSPWIPVGFRTSDCKQSNIQNRKSKIRGCSLERR